MSRRGADKPEHASGARKEQPLRETDRPPSSARSTAVAPPAVGDAVVHDPQQALERCFGDAKTFGKMVEHFLTESPALLETMRAALREQRGRDLARAAHRLGGTLIYLAARPAAEAVDRLERLGERNEFPAAERHWESVERELQRLRSALQLGLTGRAGLPNRD